MPGRHFYFAYGSNLCVRQMSLRCPDAVDPRPATLADHDIRRFVDAPATAVAAAKALIDGSLAVKSKHLADERRRFVEVLAASGPTTGLAHSAD